MSAQNNSVNVTTSTILPTLTDYDLGEIYDNIKDEKRIPLSAIQPGSRYLWARGIGCIMRVVEIRCRDDDGVPVFTAEYRDCNQNKPTTTIIFEKDAVFYPLPASLMPVRKTTSSFQDNLAPPPPPPAPPVLRRQNAVCEDSPRNVQENDGKQRGDFSFIKDNCTRFYLEDAFDRITELDLWDFLRDNNPPEDRGFMFWSHPKLTELGQKLDGGHSGASYGYTMRVMQRIAQTSWDTWVSQFKAAQATNAT